MKICKNPLCKKEFDYGTDKRVFCSPKCKNKYGYLTKPKERKVAYQQYYDQVKNPKWVKEIICACGCGRTFEKSNRGCGQAHRKYFDKTCRGKTERKVKKKLKNVVAKCRYCGLEVVGEKSHKECRLIRRQSFMLEIPCAMCGVVFRQTQFHQIYDPDCKIIADRIARKKYKLAHKDDPKPEKKKIRARVVTSVPRTPRKKDVEVKKPTSRPGSGIADLPKVSEARMREAKRMDEIVIQAWMHAPAHERRYIEANPLNKHLSFQEAA